MFLHLALHFIVPFVVAVIFFRDNLKIAYLIMLATMLVDLDHLLADPIYDPERCSIGSHPLHSLPAIAVYGVLALVTKFRYVGIGLLIHMALDSMDCYRSNGVWFLY